MIDPKNPKCPRCGGTEFSVEVVGQASEYKYGTFIAGTFYYYESEVGDVDGEYAIVHCATPACSWNARHNHITTEFHPNPEEMQ